MDSRRRKRPESGLLALCQGMGLYVNVRPVKLLEPLRAMSPLAERLGDLDVEIIRELAGGIYFGERGYSSEGGKNDPDTESYSTPEIERRHWSYTQRIVPVASARGQSQRTCQLAIWRITVSA